MTDGLRAAVVGLGWWGRHITETLDASRLIDVVRVAEPDLDRVAAFAESRGLHVDTNLSATLEDPRIDAVIIATPHLLHEEQVLAAAGAGKHVFCEKPLALTAGAARRMLAACRSRGLVLGVGHERRFEGAMEEAARMTRSGQLGTLLLIESNWSHNHFVGTTPSTWRQDPVQAPAGMLTALGVHITDLYQSVAGRVAEVGARTSHRSSQFPADDVLSVHFRFASGVLGVMSNLATTPFYGRLSVFGDQGWAEVTETSNVDVPEPARLSWRGMDDEIHTRSYPHQDSVLANLEQWASAALGLGCYRFTDDELVHNVEILEAIVRSTESGSVEKVG